MSSASIQPPRTKSPETRSGPSRHSLFLPVFIFLIGAGALAYFQVQSLSDQLDTLNRTAEGLDVRVKRAQYEKNKFFHIAHDVLLLADKNPNAEAIAARFKLRKLAQAKPELMNMNAANEFDVAHLGAAQALSTQNATNAAPPTPATNAAPAKASAPSSP